MKPRWRSLRVRLLVLATVAIAGALAAALAALTLVFHHHLHKRVESELEQRWLELASVVDLDPDGTPRLSRLPADPRYRLPFGGAYWQISTNGVPSLRSKSLLDAALPWRARSEDRDGSVADRDGIAAEITGPNGRSLDALGRTVTLPATDGDRKLTLVVALGQEETAALQTSFALDTALALLIIGCLLAAASWIQIRLGLKPLDTLRDRLIAIQENRTARLEGDFPQEVDLLVTDLNRLIDARRDQVEKARARAGDLAHALKTPLTIIEGEAQRIVRSGLADSSRLLQVQVDTMRRQVDRVLARSRTHALASTGTLSTDLARLVAGLFELMRRMPRGEDIAWTHAIPPGLLVHMDGDDMGECLGNLLDNARKWAASAVSVEALAADGRVTVSVVDDGPGLPALGEVALRRRGERSDPSVEGSGLGLAIIGDVLAAYGSELVLAAAEPRGCRASFTTRGSIASALPAANLARAPQPAVLQAR